MTDRVTKNLQLTKNILQVYGSDRASIFIFPTSLGCDVHDRDAPYLLNEITKMLKIYLSNPEAPPVLVEIPAELQQAMPIGAFKYAVFFRRQTNNNPSANAAVGGIHSIFDGICLKGPVFLSNMRPY